MSELVAFGCDAFDDSALWWSQSVVVVLESQRRLQVGASFIDATFKLVVDCFSPVAHFGALAFLREGLTAGSVVKNWTLCSASSIATILIIRSMWSLKHSAIFGTSFGHKARNIFWASAGRCLIRSVIHSWRASNVVGMILASSKREWMSLRLLGD